MDSTSQYPLDYRATEVTKECATLHDLQNHLKKTYTENVTVEFEQVTNEDERLWLYENYEKYMSQEEVTDKEKVKALQLLHRAE